MLLVPVLTSLTARYPDLEVTVLTRPKFATFFTRIAGVKILEADVDHDYQGLLGMRDLFRKLTRRADYDLIIDMHDHLRTMILRTFFRLMGKRVIVFDKGRADKRAFTRKDNKVIGRLPHTVDRYAEALHNAGFEFPLLPPPYLTADEVSAAEVDAWLTDKGLKKDRCWIGIAPFAMHKTKVWPVKNYTSLLQGLEDFGVHVFFFGGGAAEVEFLEGLISNFPNMCTRVAGHLKIRQEVALLKYIDLMLCADSSNMHLAALTGTPLLSIWGGTHPDVGFGPYRCGPESIIQKDREELPCRPCSVYGKEVCFRGDFACLAGITPDQVLGRIKAAVDQSND
jgi:ADP-heptose:LPS heptosyltransferase